MKNRIENRIIKFRKKLSEKNLDTCMILLAENRRYLSGYEGDETTFDESAGVLIITDKNLILATDPRYELQAKQEANLYEIFCYKEGLAKELPEILKMLNTKRLGFESNRLSLMQFNKIAEEIEKEKLEIELIGIDAITENIREIKEEEEIEAIHKSLFIAESVFKDFIKSIDTSMTEKEAAWAMEKRMRESGADSLSFPVIAASGQNSAMPHAIPTKKKFNEGEPILFDFGIKLNGYCSDITRTIILGKPDKIFKKVFNTVLDAQNKAIESIRPGISSKTIYNIAKDYIDNMGFPDKFRHGLGHGVGLAIHEPPRLSPFKDTILEAGMVFTVEPGIYLPDWGGVRIENMVVVREYGAQVLNTLIDNRL